MPNRELGEPLDGDHLHAWSSALNLMLYDNDPGQREVRTGGPGEERVIDRREYLVSVYAQGLLLHVDADLNRLTAVTDEARRRSKGRTRWKRPKEHVRAEVVAAELAETAGQVVREAGADGDEMSRRRLLAAADYQHTEETFAAFLGVSAGQNPDDLAEKLRQIDEE